MTSQIECLEFRSHESGALKGFANFRVEKMGLEIFGCGVFMKEGRRWLSMPSREFNDPESGEKKYISIMRFIKKEHQDSFCKAALQSMDAWCEKNAQPTEQPPAVDGYDGGVEEEGRLPF